MWREPTKGNEWEKEGCFTWEGKGTGQWGKDGKEKEHYRMRRQKGWDMNERNKKRKGNEVLTEKFITSSLFLCLLIQLY